MPFWLSGTQVRAPASSARLAARLPSAGDRHGAAVPAVADDHVGASARLDERRNALGVVLPVGVEHHDRLGRIGVGQQLRRAGRHRAALAAVFTASRRMRTRSSPASASSERGNLRRGAVVHQHDLVHVAQRGPRDVHRALRGEHRDDRCDAAGRGRAVGGGCGAGRARRAASGTSATSAVPPEPEHGAVAAAQLNGHAGERQRRRRGHPAPGEEDAAVAARLALGDEAREVSEAERGDETCAERRGGEAGAAAARLVAGAAASRPRQAAPRRSAAAAVHALGPGAAGEQHAERGEGTESERQDTGHGHAEPRLCSA